MSYYSSQLQPHVYSIFISFQTSAGSRTSEDVPHHMNGGREAQLPAQLVGKSSLGGLLCNYGLCLLSCVQTFQPVLFKH